MLKTYFRVRLSFVNRNQEQEITTFCFRHSALGLSEALSFSQPDLTYDPSIMKRKFLELDVFFDTKPSPEFFTELLKQYPQVQAHISEEESKDWLAEWKKGFVAFKLVGTTWVVPSWLENPPEATHIIKIDPGMAFGTGTHATTKMASYFIYKLSQQQLSSQQQDEKNKKLSLLDVGTGTAILAVLAEKLDFSPIVGVEIDPEARRKARENCALNETKHVDITDQQIDEIRNSYDVVVANIIDGVLIRLQSDLLRALKPNGHLILTGILQERDTHFFTKFIEQNPLRVIRRIEKDEWVGYWVQKQG